MKRLIAAVLMLLMMLGAVSCVKTKDVPDDYMSVSHADEIFNLYVPKSWQSNMDSGVSGGYSSLTTGIMASASTLSGYETVTLEECAKATVESFEATLTDFKKLTDFQKTTLGSCAALRFDYSMLSSGRTLHFRCTLVKKDDTLTVLSCCAPEESFESNETVFDDIALYFSFRDPSEIEKETEEPFVFEDENTPAGYQLAARSKYEFRFYVPKSWTVDTSGNIPSATASATDRSNVSLTSFTVKQGVMNGKEYWENFKKDYRFELNEIATDENAKLGDYNAFSAEYTATVGENTYHVKQVFLTTASIIYIFTYTSDEAHYAEHLEQVDTMLSLFEFKK